jgi:hypothetical protein
MPISFDDIKGTVRRYLDRQKQKATCTFYLEIWKVRSTAFVQKTPNIDLT